MVLVCKQSWILKEAVRALRLLQYCRFPDKNSREVSRYICNFFFAVFENSYAFISRFLAEPLTMCGILAFRGILFGKYCIKTKGFMVCAHKVTWNDTRHAQKLQMSNEDHQRSAHWWQCYHPLGYCIDTHECGAPVERKPESVSQMWGRGSVLILVTRLRGGQSGIRIPAGVIYIFLLICRLWSQISCLFIGWRGTFPGVKRLGREAYLLTSTNAEIENEWSYKSVRHIRPHGMDKGLKVSSVELLRAARSVWLLRGLDVVTWTAV